MAMKKTLQVLFGFLALGCVASGATIQLTSGGDLAAAVADETCDRIELGDGTYEVSGQVSVSRALTIVGVNGRDKVTVRQTLSSGDVRRVFRLNHASAVLQGITITGGYVYNNGNNGAGVLIDSNGGQVLDCRVTGNTMSMNTGGAICISGAAGFVARTIIDHNVNNDRYSYSGSGIRMSAGHVESCLIYGNTNSGTSRGATACYSGGVHLSGGTMSNCTVTANSGRNTGGVSVESSGKVVNCIIYGNTRTSGTSTANGVPECNLTSAYTGCLTTDPHFLNPAANDYHITTYSPARDAGTGDALAASTDLDGNPRVAGTAIDVGCYENPGSDEWIYVVGDPEDYTSITPAYGITNGLSANDELLCHAPAAWTNETVTRRAIHAGWEVRDGNGTVVATAPAGDYTYVHSGRLATLVCKWDAECRVTASAGTGGSVDIASQWIGFGQNATVEATPSPALPGCVFWKWTGDVPAGHENDNPLTLVVDAPKTLTAVFSARTNYVASAENPCATPAFPYGSRETAANSLADAVAVAMDGGVVLCEAGTHNLTAPLAVAAPITVLGEGGYGAVTVRQTLASGNARQVFTLNHEGATLRGLTITGGYTYNSGNNGAGVRIGSAGGRVVECRVTGNEASMNCYGAGLYLDSDKAAVSRCLIDGNKNANGYASHGVGIYMKAGHVDNCLFTNNTMNGTSRAYNLSGGLHAEGGTVSNCTIAANAGRGVGGVNASGSAKIVNCVICGNTRNSYKTLETGDPEWMGTASCYVNCLFPLGVAAPNDTCFLGDPHFAGVGDYHLGVGSAAHENAVAPGGWTAADLDLDGNPRVSGGLLDLGCYAYVSQGFGCTIDASSWRVHTGTSVTFRAMLDDGVDASAYRFAWSVTNTTGRIALSSAAQNPTLAFPSAGRYSVRLVVTSAATSETVFDEERPAELLVAPDIAYVRADGGHEYPYDTVATASTNVAAAFADLMDGGVLDIGEGEFTITSQLRLMEPLTIRGCGMGATTLRLQSSGTSRVLLLNDPGACVSNITVTGGKVSGTDVLSGVGIYIDSSGGTVEGCRITENTGSMNSGGAGVFVASTRGVLRRCVIDRNKITFLGARSGAGVRVTAGVVEDCLVVSNRINVYNGDGSNRYSANGGGIFAEGSNAKVRNCTVFGNYALRGGGIYATNGASVVNCIVADNALWERAERPSGITYAEPDEEPVEWYGTRSAFNHCLMPDAEGVVDAALRPNSSCLVGDPRFKDASALNFHLAKDSPAIGEGLYDAWMDASRDLDGNARVKHYKRGVGDVDIGCYETPWRKGGTVIVLR